MTDEKLLPCPFCGGEAELFSEPGDQTGEDGPIAVVTCSVCGASTGREEYDVDAIAAWNRRVSLKESEA